MKDEYPRAEKRAVVGSKCGTTPSPELLHRGGERGAGRAAASHWGRSTSRGEGTGRGSYFREAPHGPWMESCSKHAQPPRPRTPAYAESSNWHAGQERPWLDDPQSRQEALQTAASLSTSDYHPWLLSSTPSAITAWIGCRRLFPVSELVPSRASTAAGPCFLQDNMHGDSYPCCCQSIRLLTCIFANPSHRRFDSANVDVVTAACRSGVGLPLARTTVDRWGAGRVEWLTGFKHRPDPPPAREGSRPGLSRSRGLDALPLALASDSLG